MRDVAWIRNKARKLAAISIGTGLAACSLLTSLDGLNVPSGADGGTTSSSLPDGAPLSGEDAGGMTLSSPDAGSLKTDASTTGGGDTGATDAADSATGIPSPFANLVQIDVSAILTTNTVLTTSQADAGAPIVWLDGFFGQHDFATATALASLPDAGGYLGLPDNARFSGNGATIPNVQLRWQNDGNEENCVLLQNDAADAGRTNSLTFDVPPAQYKQLQIYVTGTHGSSGVASDLYATLVYSDNTTESTTVVIPAWDSALANVDAGPGEYALVSGISSINQATATIANGFTASIFAIDLNPLPSKSLVRVTLLDLGGDPGQYEFETVLFYGATAW